MTPYYEHAGITIYHGDCREVLPGLAGVVVADPPYGCSATTGWGGAHGGFSIVGDSDVVLRDWLVTFVVDHDLSAVVFGSPRIKRPDGWTLLIWSKGEHTGMGNLSFPWKPDYEEIYVRGSGFSGRRTSSVLQFNADNSSARLHPTEKPTDLMQELVGKCPPGTILDPFMGSGTTLVAAKNLGRKAIGIEVEERYCEIAAQRLSQEVLPLEAAGA